MREGHLVHSTNVGPSHKFHLEPLLTTISFKTLLIGSKIEAYNKLIEKLKRNVILPSVKRNIIIINPANITNISFELLTIEPSSISHLRWIKLANLQIFCFVFEFF